MTLIHLTRYFMLSQEDYNSNNIIPVLDNNHNVLAYIDPDLFADGSLEGSFRLNDGRVLNVSGNYAVCPMNIASILKDIADRKYRSKYGYVGLTNDCTHYMTYQVSPNSWGEGSHGNPLEPFVVVASDPQYYPYGTTLLCKQLQGMQMPDGSTHAGYLYCGDVGGAIKGANHCDWFVGLKRWELNNVIPEYVDIEIYQPNS
jgi:3D (Asp-Asp-Asp) domain-containing protein